MNRRANKEWVGTVVSVVLIFPLVWLTGCATRPIHERLTPITMPTRVAMQEEAFRVETPPDAVRMERPSTNFVYDWLSFKTWWVENGLGEPKSLSMNPLKLCGMGPLGEVLVEAGKDYVVFGDTLIYLGYPARVVDGVLVLNGLDLNKKILPLMRKRSELSSIRTVVIDPGHGGRNYGATNVWDRSVEKDLTLDWAFRLAELLSARGIKVFLTRTNDQDVPIHARVSFANAVKADLFVSLHFNSSYPDSRQAGIETYYLSPQGLPSTMNRGYADPLASYYPNNAFDELNLLWAYRIHRSLVSNTGARDRGVRHSRFMAVLRDQQCPAVLVEGGYLSNPSEARRISDPAYRQQLAEALADAIAR